VIAPPVAAKGWKRPRAFARDRAVHSARPAFCPDAPWCRC